MGWTHWMPPTTLSFDFSYLEFVKDPNNVLHQGIENQLPIPHASMGCLHISSSIRIKTFPPAYRFQSYLEFARSLGIKVSCEN